MASSDFGRDLAPRGEGGWPILVSNRVVDSDGSGRWRQGRRSGRCMQWRFSPDNTDTILWRRLLARRPIPPVTEKEYLIFLDESERKGAFFSNFYGGVIVGAAQYERVTARLAQKKRDLNFFGEVKWSKVSQPYLPKYISLISTFFEEVAAGHLRVRVMFRQNAHVPQGLSREQLEDEYFRLYYQFVKHAFGLLRMPDHGHPVNVRLYFDDLPDKEEKRQNFKGFVLVRP